MIDELRQAGDKQAEDVGVEIAVRTIKAVRPHCDGVHIMAIKATHRLSEIITKAELSADDYPRVSASQAREEEAASS